MYIKLTSNEKLAEMVGIFQGSGLIHDNNLIFLIDKKRERLIDHVSQLIESVIQVKPQKEFNGGTIKLIVSDPEAVHAFECSSRSNGTVNCFFMYV